MIVGVVIGPAHGSYPSTFVQTRSFCCSTRILLSGPSARTVMWLGGPPCETLNSHVLASFLEERNAAGGTRGGYGTAVALLGWPGPTVWIAAPSFGLRWEHPWSLHNCTSSAAAAFPSTLTVTMLT